MENQEYMLLSDDWGSVKYNDEIVIYGAGRIGRRVIPVLIKHFRIPYIIDKNSDGDQVNGIEVLDLSEGIDRVSASGHKIIVTTMRGAYNEISKELEKCGLRENKDFCIFERFAQEWNLRWQERCVLAKIDTVITSRCTLNCKNCNIFISHIDNPQDISLKDLKKNFDALFESVDFVYEYTLLGGEPFRHEKLADILEYMTGKYGDRIGKINLISNGTVTPDKETIDILKKHSISIHISDYTQTVPYKNKMNEVTNLFARNGIEHYVIPNNIWKDIVYPDLSYNAENPREHMITCGHSTHSVGDGKLYWCDPAYAAEKFLGYPSKKNDYLDLTENKKNNSKYEASLNILKYFLGNVNDDGYMSICEKCAGIGDDNDRVVEAGVQNNGE